MIRDFNSWQGKDIIRCDCLHIATADTTHLISSTGTTLCKMCFVSTDTGHILGWSCELRAMQISVDVATWLQPVNDALGTEEDKAEGSDTKGSDRYSERARRYFKGVTEPD